MLWLVAIVTSLVLIYVIIIKPHQYWKNKNVPHLKPMPIFGHMAPMFFHRISLSEYILNTIVTLKTRYFGFYQFFYPTLVIADPDLIKQIGIKDFEHFVDHKPVNVDPIFAKTLFQLKGQKWKEMRSILTPAFTSSKIKTMFFLIADCAERFTDHFVENAEPGQHTSVEMKDAFSRFSNDVIATCAFGIQCDSLTDRDNHFFDNAKKSTNFEGLNAFKFAMSTFLPSLMKWLNIRIIRSEVSNFFRNSVQRTVKEREEKGIYRPDMIHLLMQAKKRKLKYVEDAKSKDEDTGFAVAEESHIGKTEQLKPEDLSLDDLTAQAMIFYIAGFITTSALLCHIAMELATHPDIQERLHAEIDETTANCKNGKITYDDLIKMKYFDMVICEALRKWPTASVFDRVCNKTYTINPVHPGEKPLTLNVGDQIWVPTYAVHRNPENYPDPDKFDPERFSDENKKKINLSAYIPFGVGPRNCIGSRFGVLATKVIFFHLLSKMDIEVCEKTQVPFKLSRASFNLESDKGFWVGLKLRNNKID